MFKVLMFLVVFASLLFSQAPFAASPNQYSQFGNALNYHNVMIVTDYNGNKWMQTFVVPLMLSNMGYPIGEGMFHIWEFLDMNITEDPLELDDVIFGKIDQHIFTPHSIQLTPRLVDHYEIMSPYGWGMFFPVAWVGPIPPLDAGLPSCSFHYDPFSIFGSVAIMTSNTLIPPSLHGLFIPATLHTVTNFTSEAFGSGWGALSNNYFLLI